MKKASKFATLMEVRSLFDSVKKEMVAAKMPANILHLETVSLPKGFLMVVLFGSPSQGIFPSENDLKNLADHMEKTRIDQKLGAIAGLFFPPVIKVYKSSASVKSHITILMGDCRHHIYPSYSDIRNLGVHIGKALKGHGPVSYRVGPEHVVSDDRKGHQCIYGEAA